MTTLKAQIAAATTDAMRGRQRDRVRALRLVNAEIKQAEIDGREALADDGVLAVLAKMRKQRQDSLTQFSAAGREDLAAIERFELAVIGEFMPEALSAAQIEDAIAAAIAATGAATMKDMGKVMGALKTQLTGRADMAAVSKAVRAKLSG